mmetsp:Transcript_154218/g.280097  ORF Transcript_154218/g.280097 Transcript_154218/m.280097 type:complete len:298 (+) Transcript_154218:65-958(+)
MAIINQPESKIWQHQTMETYRHQRGLRNCDAGRICSGDSSSVELFSDCSFAPGSPSGEAASPTGIKAASRTSLTSLISLISISSSTDAGRSRRSFSFFAGMRMCFIPARCAAMSFSLMPPTGSTIPRREISPVMARSGRTSRPVSKETMAVVMVTPAEGPSFGTAPAGKWMCRSVPLSSRLLLPASDMPSFSACARTHPVASLTLSTMTSPSWPVIVSSPLPLILSASTKSTSPPTGVHARPQAIPGFDKRCRLSRGPSYFGGPRISVKSSACIVPPENLLPALPTLVALMLLAASA